MGFEKGVSGNPAGRPRGSGKSVALRQAIEKDVPKIVEALLEKALSGDATAARLLLERVVPALRPVSTPVAIAGMDKGSLTERGDVVLSSVADGLITPEQARSLMASLSSLCHVIETDEILKRLEALEATNED